MNLVDRKLDVLAITDEQVSKEWQLGLARQLGRLLKQTNVEGMKHLGRTSVKDEFGITVGFTRGCPIAQVRDVEESSGKQNNWGDTYDTDTQVTILSGKVTCACGEVVDQEIDKEITVGDMIRSVTSATD